MPSERLSALSGFLAEEDLAAPIDMYRKASGEILSYGTRERLSENDFVGRLLLLGLVSAAEAYFRSALAVCIEICPSCRASASSKQINLGGLLWHGKDGFSRGAFEHLSFASKEELAKYTKEFIGFKLRDEEFKSLLEEYDKVCHLRHGIVHGDGLLPGRNAVTLDIPRYDRSVRIIVRFEQLQSAAAVVGNLVSVLNRELFNLLIRRWAIDWRQRADWLPAEEEAGFKKIWGGFRSIVESGADPNVNSRDARKCMKVAKILYDVNYVRACD